MPGETPHPTQHRFLQLRPRFIHIAAPEHSRANHMGRHGLEE